MRSLSSDTVHLSGKQRRRELSSASRVCSGSCRARTRLCFETHPTGVAAVGPGLCTTRRHLSLEVMQRPANHPDKRSGDSKQNRVPQLPNIVPSESQCYQLCLAMQFDIPVCPDERESARFLSRFSGVCLRDGVGQCRVVSGDEVHVRDSR